MKRILVPVVALLLCGCVTIQDYPNKRPMSAANLQAIGQPKVVVAECLNGVEKSWFMTDSSAATAQYGLIGALVGGVMDAIMNAGPSRRAQKSADEIAEFVPADLITPSLVQQLQAHTAGGATTGVTFSSVETAQKLWKSKPQSGVLEIKTNYTLSEDASTFRVIAYVSYLDDKLKYVAPYTFKKTPPKSELTGPVYRNVFTYQSAQLPAPALVSDWRERLATSIRESYKDANGAMPVADSADDKAMKKELEKAADNELTKDETAIFLTRTWLEDHGAALKREIENAHAFIGQYVALDLNSTAVPSFTGTEELLETVGANRTVRRVGAGLEAGTYVSAPADMKGFATYGNTVSISKVQSEKIKKLTAKASAAQTKGKAKKKK
jgi:hypothetical protein